MKTPQFLPFTCWIECLECNLNTSYSHISCTSLGYWLRMGLLKLWSVSATMRSPAESDRGKTLRTAGGSTTQKWPGKLRSSPGRTEKIPGSAASWMESDVNNGLDQKMEEAIEINPISLLHLNRLWRFRLKEDNICWTQLSSQLFLKMWHEKCSVCTWKIICFVFRIVPHNLSKENAKWNTEMYSVQHKGKISWIKVSEVAGCGLICWRKSKQCRCFLRAEAQLSGSSLLINSKSLLHIVVLMSNDGVGHLPQTPISETWSMHIWPQPCVFTTSGFNWELSLTFSCTERKTLKSGWCVWEVT